MMNSSKAALVLMMFAALSTIASAQDGYLIPSKPGADELSIPSNRINQIEVDASGGMKFTDSYGQAQTLKRGDYRYIYTPMPDDVKKLKKAIFLANIPEAVTAAEAVSDKSKWLGWGAYVAYLHGIALMNQEKYTEAIKALKDGYRYANHEDRRELVDGGLEQVKQMQGGSKVGGKPTSKSELLNGMAFERSKKDPEQSLRFAVLSYMKAVTLFPPVNGKVAEGTDPETKRDMNRVSAYLRLLTTLTAVKDRATATAFAQELRQEYTIR